MNYVHTLDRHQILQSTTAYLLAAIQKVLAQSCATTAALLQEADPALLPVLLSTLTNDIADAPGIIILILDDYHVVSAPAVHDVVAFLIKYAPENLHIVISTRADPPLPLAHLRGRNQMDELRQQELRFTRAEAAQLLATALPLPAHAPLIDLLCDRAEGWPVGLQMAALSLQRHDNPAAFVQSFSGSHRHIIDYLSEEVFNRQTPEIQCFLLRTSLLERLWLARRQYAAVAPLAEQLTEQSRIMGRTRLVAKAQILLALAAFGLGDASRATQTLGRAIALAAPEHSIRLFLDEGAVMAELLALCQKRDIFPAYAALLLSAFAPGVHAALEWPVHADHNPEVGTLIEMLSQREMQVLRLMADGRSNHEIAQQLGIASSTVKTHIHTLFHKLQVTRRTQAIASARIHGLL